MPVILDKAFERFCRLFEIKYIENGLFFGKDWEHDDLIAPYDRLYIVLEGEGVIGYGQTEMVLQGGCAYIIPANLAFSCYTPNYLKKIYVHFVFDDLSCISAFDTVLKTKIDMQHYAPYYEAIVVHDASYYHRIKADFTRLIYQFIGENDVDPYKRLEGEFSPIISQLQQLLKRDLTAKTRTKDLAEDLNVSQSMLSKMFKKETGQTLKGFIQQKLIQKAQILLLTTQKSIKEIAYDLHYEDALYFSRVFKKMIGDSPTVYRKQNSVYSNPVKY